MATTTSPAYPSVLFALLGTLFLKAHSLANDLRPISNVTVVGTVYCAACSDDTFSKQSYFLQGVEVQMECKFKATGEREKFIHFSANKTTNEFGIYEFQLPSSAIDSFQCEKAGPVIESSCKASLLRNPSLSCNSPGLKSSTEHAAIKSKHPNHCIYSLNALNYNPPKRDFALCGSPKYKFQSPISVNDSKFFYPFPPLLPFPQLPPLPPLPPLPEFPPLPPFPWPFPFNTAPTPPALPFPFPQLPPLPPFQWPFPFNCTPTSSKPPAFSFPLPPLPQFPWHFPFNRSATPSLPCPFPKLPPLPPFPWPFPFNYTPTSFPLPPLPQWPWPFPTVSPPSPPSSSPQSQSP